MKAWKNGLKTVFCTMAVLCMMVVVLPILTQAAYTEGDIAGTTGTGTYGDPVICNTFKELKDALEEEEIKYIELKSAGRSTLPYMASSSSSRAIIQSVGTTKTLTITGNSEFVSNGQKFLIDVPEDTYLMINGDGRLTYTSSLTHRNMEDSSALFNVQGLCDVSGNVTLFGNANAATEAYTTGVRVFVMDGGRLNVSE